MTIRTSANHICTKSALLLAIIISFVFANKINAQITPGTPFSDNMVLQQSTNASIWGWSEPNQTMVVKGSWGAQAEVKSDAQGYWKTLIQTPAAGGPYQVELSQQTGLTPSTLTLSNVLIGEVWLASGQSNMEWTLERLGVDELDIAKLDCSNIRLFTVHHNPSKTLTNNIDADWQTCNPQHLAQFSGVGYYFAAQLVENLNVPIGIMNASYGGTKINPWTPIDAFEGGALASANANILKTDAQHAKLVDAKKSLANINANLRRGPGYLYNGMIHPLVPFTIKGTIWYQGEGNRQDGRNYGPKFIRMINAWRNKWGSELPFYFVQLAPYGYANNPAQGVHTPQLLAIVRDAQAQALTLPNTGMAVITDFGDAGDIHPRQKQPVGQRLAWLALKHTYQQDLLANSPQYSNMQIEGNKIRVNFDYADGLKSRDGIQLTWFEIAGEDQAFFPAFATIDKESVVLNSPKVSKPVAVRFAWHELANPNLVNKAGLPAMSFRTDNWPVKRLPKTAL